MHVCAHAHLTNHKSENHKAPFRVPAKIKYDSSEHPSSEKSLHTGKTLGN